LEPGLAGAADAVGRKVELGAAAAGGLDLELAGAGVAGGAEGEEEVIFPLADEFGGVGPGFVAGCPVAAKVLGRPDRGGGVRDGRGMGDGARLAQENAAEGVEPDGWSERAGGVLAAIDEDASGDDEVAGDVFGEVRAAILFLRDGVLNPNFILKIQCFSKYN
jgi:hypothetical protein